MVRTCGIAAVSGRPVTPGNQRRQLESRLYLIYLTCCRWPLTGSKRGCDLPTNAHSKCKFRSYFGQLESLLQEPVSCPKLHTNVEVEESSNTETLSMALVSVAPRATNSLNFTCPNNPPHPPSEPTIPEFTETRAAGSHAIDKSVPVEPERSVHTELGKRFVERLSLEKCLRHFSELWHFCTYYVIATLVKWYT